MYTLHYITLHYNLTQNEARPVGHLTFVSKRCFGLKLFILVIGVRARCMTWHVNLCAQPCAVRMHRNNWCERP